MKKNSFQIGVMAVDLLVDMLHRNERGVPAIPYRLMVEGSWCEGKTLLRTRLKLVRSTRSTRSRKEFKEAAVVALGHSLAPS
jgi:hypothetical protein